MKAFTLRDFVGESNRIEGIDEVRAGEVEALDRFLDEPEINTEHLVSLVSVFQAGAILRDRIGLNVRVGSHYPPPGGVEIRHKLVQLLQVVNHDLDSYERHAYRTHHQYETLHPFTDGNGRSGRALWLWCMYDYRNASLGFLHTWYYQSLQFGGKR